MRREQVHKVCCNHHLDENIKFSRMTGSDKAATWIAQDFSDGEYRPELLAIRFGKKEVVSLTLSLTKVRKRSLSCEVYSNARLILTFFLAVPRNHAVITKNQCFLVQTVI